MRAFAARLGSIAWYPCFLALAWVVGIAANGGIDPVVGWRTVVVIVASTLGIAGVMRVVVGEASRSGALATAVVLALIAAGTLATLVVFVLLLLLLLVEFRMEDQGRLSLPWPRIHELLTVASGVLLVIQLGSYWVQLIERPVASVDPAWAQPVAPPENVPNIYLIVADGHGRADTLRDDYDYDPAAFLTGLEDLGFEVAGASRANYMVTQLSLASFFSGAHIYDLGQPVGSAVDTELLAAVMRDNPATRLLQRLGYQTIAIPSGFDHLSEWGFGENLDTGQLSEYEAALLKASALGGWAAPLVRGARLAAARQRTFASLERIEQIATLQQHQPRAVFVHLPLPHPPFAVDAACQPQALFDGSFGTEDRAYWAGTALTVALTAAQTRCVDARLITTLRAVITADPTAIMILMSDHGPDEYLEWHHPDDHGLRGRFANLFAARTPGVRAMFPDDVTLVNVLPILFNATFATDLPLRPDDLYFGPSREDRKLSPVVLP